MEHLPQQLETYNRWVISQPDDPVNRADWLGGRHPTEIYIWPTLVRDVVTLDSYFDPAIHLPLESLDAGERGTALPKQRAALEAWSTQVEQLKRGSVTAVLGPPGAGKSQLAAMSARYLAQRALQYAAQPDFVEDRLPIPIVTTFRALADRSGLFPDSCPPQVVPYLEANLDRLQIWLFLDALDELPVEQAGRAPGLVKQWQDRGFRIVLTSRPAAFHALPFPGVEQWRLAPFSPESSQKFVEAWYGNGSENLRLRVLAALQDPGLKQSIRVPFLLTLLCWVNERHELQQPFGPSRIYGKAIEDLLHPLHDWRGSSATHEAALLDLLSDAAACWFAKTHGKIPVQEEDLTRWIGTSHDGRSRQGIPHWDTDGPRQLIRDLASRKLLVESAGGQAYSVVFRPILEFLAGRGLACAVAPGPGVRWLHSEAEAWELLERKSWDPEWWELIAFAGAALAERDRTGAERLVRLLAEAEADDVLRHRLALACHVAGVLARAGHGLESIRRDILSQGIEFLWRQWQRNRTWVMDRFLGQFVDLMPVLVEEPEVLAPIVAGLRNTNVCEHALYLVQALAHKAASTTIIAELLNLLDAENWEVRSASLQALKAMGREASRPDVIEKVFQCVWTDGSDFSAAAALPALAGHTPNSELVVRLFESLRDLEEHIGLWIAATIALLTTEEAEPAWIGYLAASLRDNNPRMRGGAAELAAQLKEKLATRPGIVEQLWGLIDDPSERVRASVAKALRYTAVGAGGTRVIDHLVRCLGDPSSWVRLCVARTLGELGECASGRDDVVKALLLAVQDRRSSAGLAAEEALGAFPQGAAFEGLLGMLHEPDGSFEALRALGYMGGRAMRGDVMEVLRQCIRGDDWQLRGEAIKAMAKIAGKAAPTEVLEQIQLGLSDSKDGVKAAACRAVVSIGKVAARPEIVQFLWSYLTCPILAVDAAQALGALGEAGARPDVVRELYAWTQRIDGFPPSDAHLVLSWEALVILGTFGRLPDGGGIRLFEGGPEGLRVLQVRDLAAAAQDSR